jgi:hypothetical protein
LGGSLFRKGKDSFTGNREGVDQQHTDQEYQPGHKDGHNTGHRLLAKQYTTFGIVFENGDRNTPPGEGGVEAGSQQPGTKEIPDFSGFITSSFRGEDSGDPGKIDKSPRMSCKAKAVLE